MKTSEAETSPTSPTSPLPLSATTHHSRVDDILALIDTGLQTAGDTAYGNDRKGTCWRCRAPGPDLCAGCREELLAEVERPAPVCSGLAYWVEEAYRRHHRDGTIWLTTAERDEIARVCGPRWNLLDNVTIMGYRIVLLDQPPETP